MFSTLNFAPECRALLTENTDIGVQQITPTASDIYLKPEDGKN